MSDFSLVSSDQFCFMPCALEDGLGGILLDHPS